MNRWVTVKIIRCDDPKHWYADKVGKEVKVMDLNDKWYLYANTYTIDKSLCKEVKTPKRR